ncbi:MAG: hypothetical protein L3J18_08865 [Candidatus Brocadia sp.]|jgi:Retron-type reverse transcriptase|uniref:Reverse transcriptase domain-containing protein n=1 Tax=Candidatus Brocadia fulgida TaxID=380242 RepID=A0A0M2UVS7_9BACT|nr:MAG: hypothetical protein BROFUL_02205 [Candidatus Brocadia fulgida]UJS22402.1 MAG: hypothetical protein L3J18_08865 [Candidatus Brocadia sp.]
MFWKRNNLYNDIHTDQNLTAAWNAIKSNGKVAGVDGISVQHYQGNLFLNLKLLQRELEERTYSPQPIKRFSFTKADGSKRMLGILTVRDKIVQRALYQVIEPIFERSFEDISYGYRKNRSVTEAIEHLKGYIDQGNHWIAHGDIARFFDNIDTVQLGKQITRKIDNQMILHLIHGWLDQEGAFSKTEAAPVRKKGILQGGILSPLFGNIYLDCFDKKATAQGLNIVRYADNVILIAENRCEAKKGVNQIRQLLREADLHLNERKTIITHLENGITLLGKRLILCKHGKEVTLSIQDAQKPQLR